MPLLAKRGERYIAAIQSGAGRQAYIQIEVTHDTITETRLIELDRLPNGYGPDVDPEALLAAVKPAFEQACKDYGVELSLKCVAYFPNDSKHYDIHARCVALIVRQIAEGGAFKELSE